MKHNIDPGMVQWIVKRLNEAIGEGQFSTGEVILGASEFLGRLIVSMSKTPVEGFQAAEIMENHIKATLVAGFTAKGFNMGERK